MQQGTDSKVQSDKDKVAKLERATKEKFILAGSLVARQVSQTAVLEEWRDKLTSLRLRVSRFGVPESEGGGSSSSRFCDAWTQTQDDAEATRQELARLRRRRDELLATTRNAPRNSQNMIELLKKRNAVLLAREERSLQRTKAERLEKEQRVRQLEERLATVASTCGTNY